MNVFVLFISVQLNKSSINVCKSLEGIRVCITKTLSILPVVTSETLLSEHSVRLLVHFLVTLSRYHDEN